MTTEEEGLLKLLTTNFFDWPYWGILADFYMDRGDRDSLLIARGLQYCMKNKKRPYPGLELYVWFDDKNYASSLPSELIQKMSCWNKESARVCFPDFLSSIKALGEVL